jgi:hypothetical protein
MLLSFIFKSTAEYNCGFAEGLQATAAEAPVPKPPVTKKKGKRAMPRQRQARLTNIHLKGEIDLNTKTLTK